MKDETREVTVDLTGIRLTITTESRAGTVADLEEAVRLAIIDNIENDVNCEGDGWMATDITVLST